MTQTVVTPETSASGNDGSASGRGAARPRRRLGSRLSGGHLMMLLAGALGVLVTLSAVRAAERTQPVYVAAHDLAPGDVVGAGDVRVSRVRGGDAVLSSLFGARDGDALHGQVVAVAVRAGALVGRADVHPVSDANASRVMSISLPRPRAVDGKLVVGDRVDLVAVQHDTGASGYVVTNAQIVGVDAHDGGPLSGGGADDVTISLAVDGDGALRVASAVDAGTAMLVRSTGAPELRGVAPFTIGSAK